MLSRIPGRRCAWCHPLLGIRCRLRRAHDVHQAPYEGATLLWGNYREGAPR